MKQTSLLRRLTAGATGLLIGVSGALALVSPASAHQLLVEGDVVCDDTTGQWVISWTVASDMEHEAELTEVTAELAPEIPLSTIVEGATLPARADGPLTEEHLLIGDEPIDEVTLTVTAYWEKTDVTRTGTATVSVAGECHQFQIDTHERLTVTCDLLIFLVRNNEDVDVVYRLTPNRDTSHGHTPELGELVNETADFIDVPEGTELVDEQEISAGETFELTLGPDEVHAHGFMGVEGLVVEGTVTLNDRSLPRFENAAWDSLESGRDCDGGEGGGDDELPLTGASTALIAGGAVALLALGGGLFLLARRRRVTFTA